MKFIYWDRAVFPTCQARAEPAYLFIAYFQAQVKLEYVASIVEAQEKYGTPFDQVPLLVLDNTVIAQSGSIMRYLVSVTDKSAPKDPVQRAVCDMVFE